MHPSRRAAILRGSNNAYTSTVFRSPSRILVVLLTSLVLVCVCLLLSSFSVLHRTTTPVEDVRSTHHIDAATRTSLPLRTSNNLPSQQQQQTGSSSGVVETLHRFLTQEVDAPRSTNKISTAADVVRKLTGHCGQIPSKHETGLLPTQSSQDWVLYAVDVSPSGDRSAVHLVIVPVRMLPYCRSGQWLQQPHAEKEKEEHAAVAAIRRADRDSLDHTVSASPQLLEWLQRGPRMGPNWFEGSAIELSPHLDGIEKDTVASLWFERHEDTCSYVSTTAVDLTRASSASSSSTKMILMVDHLHKNWNHVRERDEEAHFDYVLQRVSPGPLGSESEPTVVVIPLQWNAEDQVTVYDSSFDSARGTKNQKEAAGGTRDTRGLYSEWRWISTGADPIMKYANSVWKGYWLTYKTMAWSQYDRVPNLVRDYLGRMNYGRAYRLMRSSYAGEADAAPAAAKQQELGQQQVAVGVGRLHILELLRDRRLYFIGDSQIRIFFYGFLTRLGIEYPLDKVWRGDRTDHIRSHNVTVSYVASYFLNLSRPTALEMLADPSHPIVIAGVGQHHSCHCWSVDKHAAFVKEALQTLQQPHELSASVVVGASPPRQVIWFDVPAQPFNTHLYRKKPIGQSRKDCRNNARHMLYAAVQRTLVVQYLPPIVTKSGPSSSSSSEETVLPIVNAFRSSIGMQHTSLDGAHYYTWVREAWIDELVHLIEAQQRQNAQLSGM